MKMYLISDNIDTCTGMRLAGIEGAVVHEKEELKAELKKVAWPTRADTLKKTGIVIVCVIVVGIIVWIFDGIASSVIDALLSLFGQH